jgi:YegS/Rv2252/BmrU family lipid kinase
MPNERRATIFINASSGLESKQEAPQLLRKLFSGAGITADIRYVEQGVNLAELSRQAVIDGSRFVIAAGGDGTLSATASGLVGTDAAFGVLPVGTLNHFARDLSIPLNIEQAAKIVIAGHTTAVDVGEVNGKTFLNNSILGLYPIYRFLRAAEESRGWGKRMSFLLGAAKIFRRFPSLKVRLFVNGQEIARNTPYILIANNEHAMEGYHLGSRSNLSEGKLYIYVLKRRGRWGLIQLFLRLLTGQFRGRNEFEIFSAEEAWVETKGKRIGVALDGEVTVLESPLHYRLLPQSLNVLAPPPEEPPVNMTPIPVVEEKRTEQPLLSPQPA